jgi:hypothetical protein
MKQLFRIMNLAAIAVLFSCGAAQDREKIEPIYSPESLDLSSRPIAVEYWGELEATTIEPSGIRKLQNALFGWIPLVGDLLELPLDLGNALLPSLPSTIRPEIPADASWNDPRLIKMISDLRLEEAFIRIVPPAERGPNYKPERCWFGTSDCEEDGFAFLKEIRVYLIFKNLKNNASQLTDPTRPEVLIAYATTDKDYDEATQVLRFHSTGVELKQYLASYGQFEVKIIATGKYPRRKVYLDGRLRLEMGMNLN